LFYEAHLNAHRSTRCLYRLHDTDKKKEPAHERSTFKQIKLRAAYRTHRSMTTAAQRASPSGVTQQRKKTCIWAQEILNMHLTHYIRLSTFEESKQSEKLSVKHVCGW